ncbi:MAG: hypothetical protein HKN36_08235, partial [Hellea sp.]|nr:hypothetical protein [Hellea sp.]
RVRSFQDGLSDPDERRAAFQKQHRELIALAQAAQDRGEPIGIYQKGIDITDPDEMNMFLSRNITRATDADKQLDKAFGISDSKKQFGGQVEYKDAKGNIFYGTTIRDPSSAEVRANVVAADGSGRSPEGKLEIVGSTGQTAAEQLETFGKKKDIERKSDVTEALDIQQGKVEILEASRGKQLEMEKLRQDIDAGAFRTSEAMLAASEQKEKAAQTKETIKRLTDELIKNKKGLESYVGPVSQITPTLMPDTLKARTDFEQLKSILTVDNLKMMTGVLSESDIKILAAVAGGGLDPFGDDATVYSEIQRIGDAISRELSAPSSNDLTEEEMQELELLRQKQGGSL